MDYSDLTSSLEPMQRERLHTALCLLVNYLLKEAEPANETPAVLELTNEENVTTDCPYQLPLFASLPSQDAPADGKRHQSKRKQTERNKLDNEADEPSRKSEPG